MISQTCRTVQRKFRMDLEFEYYLRNETKSSSIKTSIKRCSKNIENKGFLV